VLEVNTLETLDFQDSSPLVEDLVAVEDEPFVVLDRSFLVLVEGVLRLEDNDLIALVEISLGPVLSVFWELVEDSVMLVDRDLVFDEVFVTLFEGLMALVGSVFVLVRMLLVDVKPFVGLFNVFLIDVKIFLVVVEDFVSVVPILPST
jgi:hypothetical protein